MRSEERERERGETNDTHIVTMRHKDAHTVNLWHHTQTHTHTEREREREDSERMEDRCTVSQHGNAHHATYRDPIPPAQPKSDFAHHVFPTTSMPQPLFSFKTFWSYTGPGLLM